MTAREAFLQQVRQGVSLGNRAGAAPLPARGQAGYQGAGADPLGRFCAELQAAGGVPHRARRPEEAWAAIQQVIARHAPRKLVLSRGGLVEKLGMPAKLTQQGLDVQLADANAAALFAADIGITNVEYLIAETGTVVMAAKREEPRSASLLPPVHIALAERKQLLADLFDLFDLFSPVGNVSPSVPPSCLTLITGPSKTGDIELKLVTGVHGPGEVHVVLCEW